MLSLRTSAITLVALGLALGAGAAPRPDKGLLGVKILDTWRAVLARYGQPTRVEAGPPTSGSASPTTSIGGMASFPGPGGGRGVMGSAMGMMGPAGAPGLRGMGGIGGGAPMMPSMGGMSSAGGGAPMMPSMGGMSSAGGGAPMMPSMGGMSSAGGGAPRGPSMGGSSSAGMMGGLSTPGLPRGRGSMGSGGMTLPGLGGMGPSMPGGMGGAPMPGGMSGSSMPGMPSGPTGAAGSTYGGAAVDLGPDEVAWVYEKGTDTRIFLFNNEGRVIQIQSFGYKAGARTANGVALGDRAARIYTVYGFPEQTLVTPTTRTLDYSKSANVAFQLADRSDGKGLRVVGITVALTRAPNPEKPE